MIPKRFLMDKGFTLVELIVVIAIIAILAAIAVPSVIGFVDKSREAADNASLKILNDATTYYGLSKKITNGDAFDGITTDNSRQQELVSKGFLNETTAPQQKNITFVWNITNQKWMTKGGGTSSGISIGASSKTSGKTSVGSAVILSDGIAVTGVTLDQKTMILAATTGGGRNDGPKTLTATVSPENADNKDVTWSSSDTNIATVDAKGVVRFVKPGTTVITVTTKDGNKTATCTVNTQW